MEQQKYLELYTSTLKNGIRILRWELVFGSYRSFKEKDDEIRDSLYDIEGYMSKKGMDTSVLSTRDILELNHELTSLEVKRGMRTWRTLFN